MKRTLILLITLFTTLTAGNAPWEIGVNAGGTLFHDILDDYWSSQYNVGFEVLYPFHDRVPVLLSGQGSFHTPQKNQPVRDGFHSTDYELLMFHFTLLWQYYFNQQKKVQPFVGLGPGYTMFVTAKEWPAPTNSDESEYGVSGSAGIQFSPNKRIRLYSDYRFNLTFTSPYMIHFGTARFGIRFTLGKGSVK